MDLSHMFVFLLLSALLTNATASTPLPLTISPAHVHLRLLPSTRHNVNVTCISPANITRCEFKVGPAPIIDPRLSTNTDQAVGHSFSGDEGRCHVMLPWKTFRLDGTHMEVGCRVRDDVTDWSYATMGVYGSKRSAIALNTTASEVIVGRGEEFRMVVAVTPPLSSCHAFRDNVWVPFQDEGGCEGRMCYHGGGLKAGMCGVAVDNVTEEDNGKLWLRLEDADKNEGVVLSYVIVRKPPTSLTLEYKVTSDEGGTPTLTAWCAVIGGRPPPTLAWFLADDPVTEGVVSVPDDEWAWPEDEQTINQSLTRKLSKDEIDKELRCTATFFDNNQTQTISDAKPIVFARETPTTTNPPVTAEVNSTRSPVNKSYDWHNVLIYGVAACAVFIVIVAILLYTLYAWCNRRCCFKRLSYEGSTSLDDDVMDYHVTMPTEVTSREEVESYMEPIHAVQQRDSYFLPTRTESSRTSTMKAERTLGLLQSKGPLPVPRHVQTTLKKQKNKASKPDDLFMPTPVADLDQLGDAGSYKVTEGDSVPLYVNIFPEAHTDPVVVIQDGGNNSDGCAFYGNLDAIGAKDNRDNLEGGDASDPMYGNIYPRTVDSEPIYGNF